MGHSNKGSIILETEDSAPYDTRYIHPTTDLAQQITVDDIRGVEGLANRSVAASEVTRDIST